MERDYRGAAAGVGDPVQRGPLPYAGHGFACVFAVQVGDDRSRDPRGAVIRCAGFPEAEVQLQRLHRQGPEVFRYPGVLLPVGFTPVDRIGVFAFSGLGLCSGGSHCDPVALQESCEFRLVAGQGRAVIDLLC